MYKKKNKFVQYHKYTCNLTGQVFKTTKVAKNPSELVSVLGYYDLHPEKDDRPENAKIQAKEERELEIQKEKMEEMARQEAMAKGLPNSDH